MLKDTSDLPGKLKVAEERRIAILAERAGHIAGRGAAEILGAAATVATGPAAYFVSLGLRTASEFRSSALNRELERLNNLEADLTEQLESEIDSKCCDIATVKLRDLAGEKV